MVTLITERGGAIKNLGGKLIIHDGDFLDNSLTNISTQNSGGGAVYNSAIFEANNTQFLNNTIKNEAQNSGGGALFNASGGSAKLYSTMFQANNIESDINYKKGGAIYNQGNMYIHNSGFIGNVLEGTGDNIVGGAIYNQSGTLSMDNTIFTSNPLLGLSGNKANYGGAIYNDTAGTVNIYNSSFLANMAEFAGGAIYNKGTMSIIADDGIIRIYANDDVSGTGDAIYNSGALYINAGSNTSRTFNNKHSATGFVDIRDNITGNNTGSVHINQSVKVDHDSDPSTPEINTPTTGTVFIDGIIYDNNLYLYGGNLSFAHGSIQEHFSGNITQKSGGHLWLDVDLADSAIDTINATSVAGTPELSYFRVISDMTGVKTLDVFTGAGSPSSIKTSNTYTNNTMYTVTSAAGSGQLTFEASSADGYTLARGTEGNKSFTLNDDLILTSSADNTGVFTIFGNLKDSQSKDISYNESTKTITVPDSNVEYGTHVYEISGQGKYYMVRNGANVSNVINVVDALLVNGYNAGFGGAVGGDNGQINIFNSIFVNNKVAASRNGGALSSNDTTNIFYSSFIDNYAGYRGGALSNGDNTMSVYMSVFDSNDAREGGAIATRG